MATFVDKARFGQIPVGDSTVIEVRAVEVDGKVRLDIRKFVDTPRYTGPTQQGIALDPLAAEQLLMILTEQAEAIRTALELSAPPKLKVVKKARPA